MQTIGERLEEARKRKGISIREAAEATKIRGDYLQKFESNQFDLNLAEIYVRGFLRSYAQFLKLPADKILNDLNGLGLGSRPKAPSREVYGRMELSVATAEDIAAAKKAAAAPEEPAEDSSAPARRNAPTFNRPVGSGMPPGPMIDPNLVIKGGMIVTAIIVLLLAIWGIRTMLSDDPPATPAATPMGTATAPAGVRTIRLIAVQTVSVQVNRQNPDGSVGEVLLPNTQLRQGESRNVDWPSRLFISASAGENLQLEVNGNRIGVGFTGYNRGLLPGPDEAGR